MVTPVRIGGRLLGPEQPCFIIAEAGVNHNGDVALAGRLVDAAVEARVDAVKFQTFRAERLASPAAPKAPYQRVRTDAAESQLEMLRRLELSAEAHRRLQAQCRARGILFLSTPFDEESADLLETLDVPAFKIGSGEVTNLPFLQYVARKGRPLLLSTGMSHLAEVAEALQAVRATGNDQVALLHCVSSYPADPAEANLRAMQTMADAWQVPVGFSDHTPGSAVAVAARALGACVIEKHLTLDRTLPGPDHAASLEPTDFAALVRDLRAVEAALGHGRKEPTIREAETAIAARRSLVAARPIPAGTILTEESILIQRPGNGLPPSLRSQFIGRRARRDIPTGALLAWTMVDGSVGESAGLMHASHATQGRA